MSSIWIQRWMDGYLSVQETILLITQGESDGVKGNRKRATSTRVRLQSRSTQKLYTLTQLCKNKHAGNTGTRMWGLIRIVLKCPVKIQNKTTHNWLFYFIFIVLLMINITGFLQMHVYHLTCDQLWKTCLLDAHHENECPSDKRHSFASLNIYIVLGAWRPHNECSLCLYVCEKHDTWFFPNCTFR